MQTSFVRMSVAGLGALLIGFGCNSPAFQRQVSLPLTSSQSSFEVEADTPLRQTGTYTFDTGDITVGSGSLNVSTDDITFTPADTGDGKSRLTLQAQESQVVITVWVDGPDQLETVCDTGDEYGPFTVDLVDNVPVDVSPTSVNLTDKTLDLLNDGELTLCIEVVSDQPGTVTIERLGLSLGL